jgi:hypothetical protein
VKEMSERDDESKAARKMLEDRGQRVRSKGDGRYQRIDANTGERIGRPLTKAELIDKADGNG